jgi:hypothetical protein
MGASRRELMPSDIQSAMRRVQSKGLTLTFKMRSGRLTTNTMQTRISPLSSTLNWMVWKAAWNCPGP